MRKYPMVLSLLLIELIKDCSSAVVVWVELNRKEIFVKNLFSLDVIFGNPLLLSHRYSACQVIISWILCRFDLLP